MQQRPVIGIPTQNLQSIDRIPEDLPASWVMNQRYFLACTSVGAVPWMVPLLDEDPETLRAIYERLDGIFLAGGVDMDPASYGEERHELCGRTDLPRDAVDGLNGYRTQQAVIAFQSWEGLGRDGVVGPQTSRALAVARRPKPQRGGPSKRIEVYIEKGVTLLVKNGRTKRAIHSSAGAPGTDTPTGRYQVFRKELQSWSVPFSTWLPYASYFNNGIAFHE